MSGARSKGTWMAESHDHLSCQEVVELVTDYLDGALSVEGASLFEQHLNFCDGCIWYVDQIKTTVEAVGEVREDDIPSEAKDRLMAAFRDWKGS
jgi:anti-sigma factor RsiW